MKNNLTSCFFTLMLTFTFYKIHSQTISCGVVSKNTHPEYAFQAFQFSAQKAAIIVCKLSTEYGTSYTMDIVGGDQLAFGKTFALTGIKGNFSESADYYSFFNYQNQNYLLRIGENKKRDLGIVYFQTTEDFLDSKTDLILADTFYHKGQLIIPYYAISPDQKQFILVDENSFRKESGKTELNISWFDGKMNLLKRETYSFPAEEKLINNYQFAITNEGKIFAVVKSSKVFSSVETFLLVQKNNSKEFSKIVLDQSLVQKNPYMLSRGLDILPDGSNVTLIFREVANTGNGKAIAFAVISPSATSIEWQTLPLNKSSFEINAVDTSDLLVSPRNIKSVITSDHRIISIWGIYSSVLTGVVPAGTSPVPYTKYTGGNITIFCQDSTGKQLWHSVIPRSQSNVGQPLFLAPFATEYSNDIIIGFNGDRDLMNKTNLNYTRIDPFGKCTSAKLVLPPAIDQMNFNPLMVSPEPKEKRITLLYEDYNHSQFAIAYLYPENK